MLNEPNKDEKQEKPAAPTSHPEEPHATDVENGDSQPASGTLAGEGQEQPQGTGPDGARGPDDVPQIESLGAAGGENQDGTPDAQGKSDSGLSGGAQTEQKPVSADGTDMPHAEGSPDPSTVTGELEEEEEMAARVMRSYDEAIGRGNIHEPVDDPDGADQEPESATWPEYEEYEPEPTTTLIRREGRIQVARIEWKGFRPVVTLVSDRYSIPSMPSAVYRTLRLPSGVAEYQSAGQVFNAVYEVLQSCSALSRQQCELLTFWCIASWFQDSLDFLPRVTVSGPRFAANLLLTLLAYVCPKAIKLIDMSSAVLKQIGMEELRPTLLIHQIKASKAATQLLEATDYPGYIFADGGDLRQFCCAKVVYVGETFKPSQNTSALHIHLSRNASVPSAPYRSSVGIEDLQNQLVSYFAFNHNRIHFLKVSPGELQPDFDVMARRLGAVIINDGALQRRLVELLKGWSEDVRAERAGGVEATVLTAALKLGHGSEPKAYAREIAAGVNQIGTERGESYKLSNEKVGRVLRELGLRTRHDMNGRALVFDQATQVLLHELCFEYDVLPAAPQCGYCHKLQAPESE